MLCPYGKHVMKINKTNKTNRAQVIIEFTFCMIIVFLMIYATIKIFRWTGLDLANRRQNHDAVLTGAINRLGTCVDMNVWCDGYSTEETGPLKQIDPYFSGSTKMNAIWKGN